MQRRIPLILEDGRPLDSLEWAVTWGALWAAMGREGTPWASASEWAAHAGGDEERTRYLLATARREKLVRRRPGGEQGTYRYARTDVVASRWSPAELVAFNPQGWRWNYDDALVRYLAVPDLSPDLDPDVLSEGEESVMAALPRLGNFTRAEVWYAAQGRGVSKSTFYASWARLTERGVLSQVAGRRLWRYVLPDDRVS